MFTAPLKTIITVFVKNHPAIQLTDNKYYYIFHLSLCLITDDISPHNGQNIWLFYNDMVKNKTSATVYLLKP